MPRINNVGFTKSDQKVKFQRNRDKVLKKCETNQEARIEKGMVEGICPRCRDKVEWRFQYNKYKPLKQPGACSKCCKRTVLKAYRTWCDDCSKKAKCCPACCLSRKEWREDEVEEIEGGKDVDDDEEEEEEEVVEKKAKKCTRKIVEGGDTRPQWLRNREAMERTAQAGAAPPSASTSASTGVEKVGEEDEDEDEDGGDVADEIEADEDEDVDMDMEDYAADADALSMAPELKWNEKAFNNVASSKYSKSRETGAETDVFQFTDK